MPISLQTGIREYTGDLTPYTGVLGGLTPDVHTLRSLNPLTNNRLIAVMYRGPYFLMHYFAGSSGSAFTNKEFATYKKLIEYYNLGIQCNIGDSTLTPATLQGGFSARTINFPTTQSQQGQQTLTITVPELVGRPVATFHNMWIDGIADPITGLTTYHGLVAGSVSVQDQTPQRIFAPNTGANASALEPSPAWEVAEFLIIALDRSGARVDGAVMALGCVPQAKVGNNLFNSNANGQSAIEQLQLVYSCQFVQSTYVNDLAARYVRQFAVFGNSMNFNPGAGDAFFDPNKLSSYGDINSAMFNGGKRPNLDAVQSALGNAPVVSSSYEGIQRTMPSDRILEKEDHSKIYNNTHWSQFTDIGNPYGANPADEGNQNVDNENRYSTTPGSTRNFYTAQADTTRG